MPQRAPRHCPRCGNAYVGRCQVCAQRWRHTTELRQAGRPDPYDDPQWRRFSRAYLREHPTCECDDHVRLPAWRRPRSQVVDHIDGLGPLGPRGYDLTNLQALTRPCHARKTAMHDGGYGHRRTDADDPRRSHADDPARG
jgi:5-methylcytosine-specific restriction protein A